jgi:hypothetical protein
MRRRLSSGLTPFYKFGLPGLWFASATYSLADYISSWSDSTLPNNFVPICILFVFGGALFVWKFGPLKRIYLDGDCLSVSNYRREILIPFANIQDVREANWLTNSPRRIIVTLKSQSCFGTKIQFAPEFFSTPMVISELKDRATRGQASR